MLKAEENELLTRVGPDTPGGQLLRRYWHPVCYAEQLDRQPTLAVKMLGEELVVYRDSTGAYGLLAEHCSHRGTSLAYGFVEANCRLRCCYHGWTYDADGNVVEQPFEPRGSNFKAKLKHPAYQVQELGGMVFGYLGPQPAPLLPRWDVLVRTDGHPELTESTELVCNWLQVQENSADVVHTYYLHAKMLEAQGVLEHPGLAYYNRPFLAYGFKRFEWGILKSFVTETNGVRQSEIGNPLIFPNMLRVLEGRNNEAMHWRVPVDDEHTRIFHAAFLVDPDGSSTPRHGNPKMHLEGVKFSSDGRYALHDFYPQDWMAWETQGTIFDRSKERLGASDRGITMFRKMLRENIEIVREGGEPMALLRDPAENEQIDFVTMAEEPVEESDVSYEVEGVSS